ncbi:PEP/pyruvate-binding domain-containing protein [Roseovarius sp. M141]|uniref:PEP/pyruvate-binding domain-containing protein n=1 Tax=Roseovarius sp. M141 TaxID=2583806 RepID=UPI0020CB79C2|nr:PEP/pyruvate-binding domain-containing protein [Roseovarius sp. M141]
MVLASLAFAMLNIWQFRSENAREMARLQATLVRPAQFDGTEIQDKALVETSFDQQSESLNALSTDEAEKLLQDDAGDTPTLFFDIRETAEHAMGTLPGARHVRYPDFLQSDIPLDGKQVVLFCHNGNRSSETCAKLAARGIDCRFIAGGIEKWIVEGRKFSDHSVGSLSDLRAIPEYDNKSTLLGTSDFEHLLSGEDLQIVDTRYPGDFATGHLPGAINIPVRALPTDEMKRRIELLKDKPTIAACYDRRSCFMAQVLGFELSQAGLDFRGRYTTPWDYFVRPEPKPHVQQWMAEQNVTLWQKAVSRLAEALLWIGDRTYFVVGLIALSLLSRILVLPIALKSERDQMVTAKYAVEMKALKERLRSDPTRKARAVQAFYTDKGLTPMRNLIALLFLPVMMLGLGAVEKASVSTSASFLWVSQLGMPDHTYILPGIFALLAGIYLHWAVAKSTKQATLCWIIGAPAMFALVFQLSAAGNIYLCTSLILLLVQRAFVVGLVQRSGSAVQHAWQRWKVRNIFHGIVPLDYTGALIGSGNKSYRLSVLKKAGVPVPGGVVIRSDAIEAYTQMATKDKEAFSGMIWRMVGQKPCAVRSSASNEDGADQSFAGVFDSVLEVEQAGMREALDEVVASFSSARAATYNHDEGTSAEGNILVQQMVRSEFAGVLFTEDPTAPGMMMVELVEGCGDDLVSGRVTPQSLRFGRYTLLPAHDEDGPIDIKPLLELGKKIEEVFGCPQDIEWAYADGAFQIVQSRDITTLAAGGAVERARLDEWRRILSHYGDAAPDQVILAQDEMSEVLPRPTPLSFSLMATLWSPGGSVDLACRQLGVRYDLPEGRPGHLVNLFGRTYVDCALKSQMTLRLSNTKARQLRKQAVPMISDFRDHVMPGLEEDMIIWRATDFTALPERQIITSIRQLHDKLRHDIYVEAEKINILAGFLMTEAETYCQKDEAARQRLLHPVLSHAPVNLIESCASLTEDHQRNALMAMMGHRAIFDYELSTPRYSEAPDLLWQLLKGASATPANLDSATGLSGQYDPVDLAIAFQDLKEQAKHEALKIVAEIRRAILALGVKTELGDLIFQLDIQDLFEIQHLDLERVKVEADIRRSTTESLIKSAPRQVLLTLRDCELFSLDHRAGARSEGGELGGVVVSGGKGASGRVFLVDDESVVDSSAFAGFQDGDIIVCRMVSPAWLPFVMRSGAVLCEVGGWLSHMAIVAREKDILMLVGCSGLNRLVNGTPVEVTADGAISVIETADTERLRSA